MATSRNILCAICEAQHITKYADQWFPECDEGLCSDCETHHNISKASRNHGVFLKQLSLLSNFRHILLPVLRNFVYIVLISVKLCSMLSINVDVFDVLHQLLS
jgi:hypothetical protein